MPDIFQPTLRTVEVGRATFVIVKGSACLLDLTFN